MAQNQGIFHVCRSCRKQLQNLSLNTRSFSTTQQQKKIIPSFTPTSNPRIDEIFLTFREKVFTPEALSEHHRRMIYKTSRKQMLENDPGVTVTLANDEEVKLKPMNRFDRPKKHKSLVELCNLLGETDDATVWGNLPAFLEGMKQSNQVVQETYLERISRKAVEQGRMGIIVRCAERASKTGVKLSQPNTTRELMLGCHLEAAAADFQGEELNRAVKRAETIALLLEKKEHCGAALGAGEVDMRRNLLVVGVLLELAAAKAVNVDGGKDTDGKVASYVTKALALSEKDFRSNWSKATEIEQQRPKNAKAAAASEAAAASRYLEELLPLWNGMKLASNIDGIAGTELATSLKTRFQALQKELDSTRANVKPAKHGGPRRAVQMYDALQ